MTYTKRTNTIPIGEVRRDMLNDMGVSVDYYPASDSPNQHCAWVCTDMNCKQCGKSFQSYPAFKGHLRIHHGLEYSERETELWMRQKYHDIRN